MYQEARERYAAWGVDTDAAIARLKEIPVSIHCWQGDDVTGLENAGEALSGILAALREKGLEPVPVGEVLP